MWTRLQVRLRQQCDTGHVLGFVTSVRHPINSSDYSRVEELLRTTLASWSRQDHPGWLGVVVGNRQPSVELPRGVEFLQVDFEPPSQLRGPRTGIPAVLKDKGTKLAVGLDVARTRGATHIMFVDADDFISRRLASYVAAHKDEPGWTITHGWRYNSKRRALREHAGDFHLQCGSSHLVRADLYPRPELPARPTQSDLYAGYGDKLERWIGSHMHIHDDLTLAELPFHGAIYQVGTTETHSGNGMGGWGRPVPASVAEEFGVESTGRLPWRVARAVLPSPSAIKNRLLREPRPLHPR